MATILEKANQILNEKNTKLLPENLKAGITCLGVDGALTLEIKKFNNMEELLADTDTDCLKMICKPTVFGEPVQVGDEMLQGNYIAKNFTLSEPITEDTTWTMSTVPYTNGLSATCAVELVLTPTTATLRITIKAITTVTSSWSYVSEDGIHYHFANDPEEGYSNDKIQIIGINVYLGTIESFTGEINKLFTLQPYDGYEFKGIYEYKDEAWQLITTQLTGTAREVLQGHTVYTNDGVVEGTIIDGTNINTMINVANDETGIILKDDEQRIELNSDIYQDVWALGGGHSLGVHTTYSALANKIGITPEKIAKGNSILGIEGAHEGGSSDIKLFETTDEMQADPNAKEGNLAVIYRSAVRNATASDRFSSARFPQTVVLPTAMTSSADVMYRATDNSVMFDCWGQLNGTMFDMSCYSESGETRIRYTSSDGITYTRTDGGDETMDFGTEIYCPYSDYWNDATGYFIQLGSYNFEGLFQYQPYTDKNVIRLPLISDITVTPEAFTFNGTYSEEYSVEKITAILEKIIADNNYTYTSGTGLMRFGVFVKGNNVIAMTSVDSNNGIVNQANEHYDAVTSKFQLSCSYTLSCTHRFYILDLENLTYTLDYEVGTNGSQPAPYYSVIDYAFDTLVTTAALNTSGSWSWSAWSPNLAMSYINGTTSQYVPCKNYPTSVHVDKIGYILATTQLDATTDYTFKKTFYGKNGIEVGTLGNPDNTLADTNAELYTSIQENYNNMQPIIVKDGASLDNIKCIPIKYDNTLLIDTSEMTSGRALFMGNSYIKHIPKINTSHMTDIYGMFSDCPAIETIADIDTSSATELTTLFSNCAKLKYIPNIDTGNATSLWMTFAGCETITTIPQLNTSKVTDMRDTFGGCINLIDIPVLDTSSVTQFGSWRYGSTFGNCSSLSNNSLNNILQMCINAVNYTGTKTLKYLGLTEAQATTCTGLSNYAAFTAAGWTTGY